MLVLSQKNKKIVGKKNLVGSANAEGKVEKDCSRLPNKTLRTNSRISGCLQIADFADIQGDPKLAPPLGRRSGMT